MTPSHDNLEDLIKLFFPNTEWSPQSATSTAWSDIINIGFLRVVLTVTRDTMDAKILAISQGSLSKTV